MKRIITSPFVAAIVLYLSVIRQMPEMVTIDYTHDIVRSSSGEALFSLTACRDTIGHFCLYCALSVAIFFDLKRFTHCSSKRRALITILVPTIFGIAMEIIQKEFFPPRSCEWNDIITNAVGALTGYFVAKRINEKSVRLP